MSDYYVYIHKKSTTGEVFYVGKGSGNRAYNRSNRTLWWKRLVAKHGYDVEIVASGLQEWYAFELEVELITRYGRRDINEGSLINRTDGGDGCSGVIFTEEVRKKISDSKIGNTHTLGKKFTEEHRRKISEAHRGKTFTAQHVANMVEVNRHKMIPVIRNDGVMYESLHAAAKDTGAHPSNISACCKGRIKQSGGYSWKFVDNIT
jgi:hypothetical protein